MITQLSHIAFRVKDMDAALDFYCGKLGLPEAFRLHREDGSLWIVYLKAGNGSFIELFPVEVTTPSQGSYVHFCLSVDDLSATLEELRIRGMDCPGEPNRGKDGNLQYWIADPEGNKVELMQIMPDSLQGKAYE